MRQRRLFVTGAALVLNVLICICTMALIQPPVASAHAYVIGSDPIDGSTVAQVPKAIHISFNAAVSPLSRAHVYFIRDGDLIDVGATPSQVAPSNPRELVIPLKKPSAMLQGGYEVIWTAVANDDGHTTYGIIGFNVGISGATLLGFTVKNPILGPSTSNDLEGIHTLNSIALLAIVWEWLVLLALTVWIGILLIEQFILMEGGRGTAFLAQVRKHTCLLQRLCLATLLFGESVELFLRAIHLAQIQRSDDFPLALVFSMIAKTGYGHIWLVRMVLIALIMGLLYWTHRLRKKKTASESALLTTQSDRLQPQPTEEAQRAETNQTEVKEPAEAMPALPGSSHRVVWLFLAGLLALLFVLTHPAAQPHLSAIFVDWLKTVAQGIWFGGIAYLGYILLPALRTKNRDDDIRTLVTVQRWLTPVLLVSMAIQLFCLFFLSDTSIHDPQQWLTDPYGRVQAIQVLIIVMMALLSIYVLVVLCPRMVHQAQFLLDAKGELADRRIRLSVLSTIKGRFKITANMLALLGAGALLCSAVMDFFAPPIVFPDVTYTNQAALSTSTAHAQTKQIGSFSVTLELLPGRSGEANTVIMLIKDRNGKPVTDAQIRLSTNMQTMDMGTRHALITGGNPVYTTMFDQREAFTMAGPWVIDVEIQRPNQQVAQGTFQVVLSSNDSIP